MWGGGIDREGTKEAEYEQLVSDRFTDVHFTIPVNFWKFFRNKKMRGKCFRIKFRGEKNCGIT